MNFIFRVLTVVVFVCATINANAQRYLNEIFDTYQLTQDQTFGVNIDFLLSDLSDLAAFTVERNEVDALILDGETANIPVKYFTPNPFLPEEEHTSLKLAQLQMDIYSPPVEDTETERPMVIYLHTGNFLPPLYNGSPLGDKRDSCAVNMCEQFAKRGYVAASINYRLGWNPLSTDENVRRGTLLQAVYRALHDCQSSVRFLRSQAEDLGADPNKIILFGQGSGGYVAQAYVTLNEYTEIASLPKFIDFSQDPAIPYVIEAVHGGINGEAGAVRLSDPLQIAGISKEVSMAANAGGALADESWLEDGDVPMVSFHCLRDAAAPFNEGTVIVGVTNENVVDVHGPNIFIQKANDFGNNDAFASIPDGDVYTDEARAKYGNTYEYIYPTEPTMTVAPTPEGLYTFLLPIGETIANNQSNPWDWWSLPTLEAVVAATNAQLGTTFDAAAINDSELASHPNMSQEQGLAYIDTIQGYLNPRIVLGADLVTGVAELPEVQTAMDIFPNPATDFVTIRNEKARIREVVLFNGLGQEVARHTVNDITYRIDTKGFENGMYFATIIFEEGGQMTRNIVLK